MLIPSNEIPAKSENFSNQKNFKRLSETTVAVFMFCFYVRVLYHAKFEFNM